MSESASMSAAPQRPLKVLLTGAAGFIGSAVADLLNERGYEVVGLDAWIPQAHADDAAAADAADGGPRAGIRRIDVRDAERLREALTDVDVVCHQAAMVGAGLTPADLPLYASHNDLGTAVLLAEMARAGVRKLVLASSMVVYGDGRYSCPTHGVRRPAPRCLSDLDAGRFDVSCPECGVALHWQLVDEDAPLLPRSSYAASKVAQEHYSVAWARQAGSAVIALRYHNVYGPGMPPDTPYAGVAAIFRSALERGEAPRVFEDGGQMRDFVHVSDVAEANALAVEQVIDRAADSFSAYNVCSGHPVSILQVARAVVRGLAADSKGPEPGPDLGTPDSGTPDMEATESEGSAWEPVVTGDYRTGDVRHVVASPQRAAGELGFTAAVSPAEGLAAFARAPLRGR